MFAYRLRYDSGTHALRVITPLWNFQLAMAMLCKQKVPPGEVQTAQGKAAKYESFITYGQPWAYGKSLCSEEVCIGGVPMVDTCCAYVCQPKSRQYDWLHGLVRTASLNQLFGLLMAYGWMEESEWVFYEMPAEAWPQFVTRDPLLQIFAINCVEDQGGSCLSCFFTAEFLRGLRAVWEAKPKETAEILRAAMVDAVASTLGNSQALRGKVFASMQGHRLVFNLPTSVGLGSVCGTQSSLEELQDDGKYPMDCGNMEQPEQALVALAGLAKATELVEAQLGL